MRLIVCLFLVACGASEPAAPPADAPAAPPAAPAADPHAGHADAAAGPATEAPPAGASVNFVGLAEGDEVKSPINLQFGVSGMAVAPAGALAAGTGHHHLIVDGEAPPLGEAVPKDATHIHYGKGETTATLELAPGPHTLTLQFADGLHRSYGPDMRQTLSITVVGAAAP
jgi:hypothetical protein